MRRAADGIIAVTDTTPQKLGLLAKSVIAIGAMLVIGGIAWHGFTLQTMQRLWTDLVARPDAPMRFRFILQPLMAAIVATLDGVRDARTGRAPYFWTVLSKPQERVGLLREALNATARIILLGIVMDLIYQALVLKQFYPGEAIIVALLVAFVPYVIFRGPAQRIAMMLRGSAARRRSREHDPTA